MYGLSQEVPWEFTAPLEHGVVVEVTQADVYVLLRDDKTRVSH